MRTHGCSIKAKGTPEYATYLAWLSMRWRCTNRNRRDYVRYGGRGIKVCDRWSHFANFMADMGLRPEGMQLDRVNNDGNYEPSNCRWATPKQQARNRSNNNPITFNGETKTRAEWCEQLGLTKHAIRHRLRKGWCIEEAVTTPKTTRWNRHRVTA